MAANLPRDRLAAAAAAPSSRGRRRCCSRRRWGLPVRTLSRLPLARQSLRAASAEQLSDRPPRLFFCLPGQHIICEHPNPPGYVLLTGNLNLSAGTFAVEASCRSGFEGTAQATPCTDSGPYGLSGCTPIVCIQAPDQQGYTIRDAVNLDLGQGPMDTDVECATGFGATPVATPCATTGEPYTLAGCSRVYCARKDCAITQMLKPGATETLPELGVAATDEICCDLREGYCKFNRNATGNHTELAVVDGHDTYQVACGSGYGLVPGAQVIERLPAQSRRP
jgi:hypothetical protein